MNKRLLAFCVLIGVAICPGMALGQATEGTILGSVRDSSGASVPGAAITVTNVLTNSMRQSESSESGEYVITNLPVGSYKVRAEKPGFQTAVQPPVELTVKARARRSKLAGGRHYSNH